MGNKLETFYQVETQIGMTEDWHRHDEHYLTLKDVQNSSWNLKTETVRVVKVTEHIIEEVVTNA